MYSDLKKHDFVISLIDTDALTISKKDGAEFQQTEIDGLTEELNSLFEDLIRWEFEFYIPKIVVLKSKNYVLKYDDKKIKIKGSALVDQKSSKKILQFKRDIVNCFLEDREQDIINVYNKYALEIMNITEIKPWAKKLTVTEKVLNPKRTNEQKVLDAIEGRNYQAGDKIWVYYREDNSLSLIDNWDGKDYNRDTLLNNLFTSLKIFKHVLDITQYSNYKLKRNKKLLGELT